MITKKATLDWLENQLPIVIAYTLWLVAIAGFVMWVLGY